MLIIPAIDLKDRQVVRLKQGRMEDATAYNSDPVAQASHWIKIMESSKQESRLHLVDLNGAFEGKPVHFDIIKKISVKHPNTKIEIGGGIRNLETIQQYIDSGVTYCILGTAAVKNPQLLFEACKKFPKQIILGIDAKNGLVATEGWDKTSHKTAIDLVKEFAEAQIESVIYTDIAKDGMMQGMNHKAITEMANESPFPIIASGGLTALSDIDQLNKMQNILGVIAGKALYEGAFKLEEAIVNS